MTTVGFGDVHPEGQVGFDVVFLAAFAGLVKSRVRRNDRWPDEP